MTNPRTGVPPPIEPERERRAWLTLLGVESLLNVGFYILIPLISVHYTRDVGLSAAAVGFVLGLRPLVQQVPSTFTGALADRIGYRPSIAIGLFVRGIGFLILVVADDLPRLIAGVVVFGLGGALIWANGRAAMAAISSAAALPGRYALANTLENAISALAPLFGVFLLHYDFAWVCLTGAIASFAACLLTLIGLPPVPVAGAAAPSLGAVLKIVGRDRPFVIFTVLMAGHWFLFSQLFITVPLRAVAVTGTTDTVGLLYTVNAVTLVALTYLVIRTLSRRWEPVQVLPVGLVLMGLGLGSYAIDLGLPGLIAGIAVYAIGWMLAEPMRQTLNARVAPPHVRAAYFGFGMLSIGLGGSVGQFAGGWLYDVGQAAQRPDLPWIASAVVGLTVAAAVIVFARAVKHPWVA